MLLFGMFVGWPAGSDASATLVLGLEFAGRPGLNRRPAWWLQPRSRGADILGRREIRFVDWRRTGVGRDRLRRRFVIEEQEPRDDAEEDDPHNAEHRPENQHIVVAGLFPGLALRALLRPALLVKPFVVRVFDDEAIFAFRTVDLLSDQRRVAHWHLGLARRALHLKTGVRRHPKSPRAVR